MPDSAGIEDVDKVQYLSSKNEPASSFLIGCIGFVVIVDSEIADELYFDD